MGGSSGWLALTSGVTAVAVTVALSGPAQAAPALLAGSADEPGLSALEWEGPYASREVQGGDALQARKAKDHDLRRSGEAPGEEVVDARTERSKTYAGEEPGQFETRLFAEPVHTIDEGEWVEIDTALVAGADGRLSPKVAGVEVSIAPEAGAPELVRLQLPEDKGSIGWSLRGAARSDKAAAPEKGLGAALPGQARGTVKKDTITYQGVVPGVGLELTARSTGIKENLVLQDKDAPKVYFFDLDVDGVQVREAGDGLVFVDGAGQTVAAVPAGYMQDADGAVSPGVEMRLVGPKNDPVLKVSIDSAWLAEKERAFPVLVDPMVEVRSGVVDTHVESDRPTTNFSGYGFMRVGRDSARTARGFIKFDLSSLNGKTIDYANLRFSNRTSVDCTKRTVTAHPIKASWDPNAVSYPGPGYDAKIGEVSIGAGATGCAAAQADMPISQVVRDWTAGDRSNHGLALLGNESDTRSMKVIDSSNAADAAVRPHLVVSWRDSLLGQLGYYTMDTQELTDRSQMSVNVANGNLLVQHVDVALSGNAGLGLNVGRYYNSREDTINPKRAGQTGAGWTLDVGSDVRLSMTSGADGSAYFEGPSGYRVVFKKIGTNKWERPPGLNAELLKAFNGHDYTVHMVDTGMYYHFDGGAALDMIEDQRGNKITMNYASNGETLQSITDTRGGRTTFGYNASGLVSTIADPFGRTTTFAYSGDSLVSSTDSTGKVTRYQYDANRNMSAFIDPRGGTTRYGYNAEDELTSITWADSTSTSPKVTTYNRTYEPTISMTDPNGSSDWTWVFDRKGRLETFYSPRSGVGTDYAYNAFNAVTSYTSNTGGIGTITYDGYNVKSIQSANGATSQFEYPTASSGSPAPNRPTKFTNAQGVALSYQWANSQEMTTVTQDSTVMSRMTYRLKGAACAGSLDRATDGRGQVTIYSYDSRCRLTKVDRPAPMGDTTLTYDGQDRVRTVTDARGIGQTISYDNLDRVTQVVYTTPGSTATDRVSYSYDANGNRTTRTDTVPGKAAKSSSWTLDARNRVLSETLPEGNNTYTYDKVGNLATLTNAWGTTRYTYDAENDVKSITPPTGPAIAFDYYEHTYAAVKFPNGVTDAQHYDTDGRIQKIDQYFYNQSTYRQLARQDLNYKGTDSLHEITDPAFNYSLKYTYDSKGRIATSYGVSEGDIFENNSYQYDNNSNRTSWTFGSRDTVVSYRGTYNAADQLTSVSEQWPGQAARSTTYSYDTVGNQTGNSAGAQMTYDARGRATSVKHEHSTRGAEAGEYNGTSQVERTRIGGWTFTNSVVGVTSSTQSAEGTRHYVHAPDGRVLAEYRAKDGQWRYYLTNHQGSIVGGTDSAGWQTESYGYGPYGEYQYGSGGGTNLIHWRYTGEWLDGDSVSGNGYYKIGLRYYDDHQGRWTQTDPAERVVNPMQPSEAQPYNYAGCNPTNQTDPTGAMSMWEGVATFAGGVLACAETGLLVGGYGAAVGALFPGVGSVAGGVVGGLYGCGAGVIMYGLTGWNPPGF